MPLNALSSSRFHADCSTSNSTCASRPLQHAAVSLAPLLRTVTSYRAAPAVCLLLSSFVPSLDASSSRLSLPPPPRPSIVVHCPAMTTALTNLYVRNLPMEWTAADLIALGEKYGPVVSAKVLYNPLTTASRGMGFIRFAEHADATLAIAGMNGHIPDSAVHAKPLNVQFAKDQQSDGSRHTQHMQHTTDAAAATSTGHTTSPSYNTRRQRERGSAGCIISRHSACRSRYHWRAAATLPPLLGTFSLLAGV